VEIRYRKKYLKLSVKIRDFGENDPLSKSGRDATENVPKA
jgi:hypothetical protein